MFENQKTNKKPVVLVIMDGLGVATPNKGNAVTLAKTPNLDIYWPKYPHTYLEASGKFVGLPNGVMGNSEVGHMSLGSGQIMYQEIARIDNDIETGKFYKNQTFQEAVDHVKKTNGRLHLMGLLSPGKVHAAPNHLFASIEFCKKQGLKKDQVAIHVFTDGRDSEPKSAGEYIGELEAKCKFLGVGVIASIIGRYYAMDRDNRWDRIELAYNLLTKANGKQIQNWQQALDESYSQDITDEFIKPFALVDKNNKPIAKVSSGDGLVFFNFRPDRAIQLSKAFIDKSFNQFERVVLEDFYFAGFSNYQKGVVMNRAKEDEINYGGESQMVEHLFEEELKKQDDMFPPNQIFPPQKIEYSLGKVISEAGLSQLRLAESEKFPHVTYFFNCREKNAFEREERIEIPSPKEVSTYDQKPEMSSYELTDLFVANLNKNIYDFILINFAQGDMVGHTGNLKASIKAVETIDDNVGRIVKNVLEKDGTVLITADHGNVEELLNLQTQEIDTMHSTNEVPFMYISKKHEGEKELPRGTLSDIATTILTTLNISIPSSFSGRDLLG